MTHGHSTSSDAPTVTERDEELHVATMSASSSRTSPFLILRSLMNPMARRTNSDVATKAQAQKAIDARSLTQDVTATAADRLHAAMRGVAGCCSWTPVTTNRTGAVEVVDVVRLAPSCARPTTLARFALA